MDKEISELFIENHGHEHGFRWYGHQTDVFLISAALSYATDEPVYLFSQDIPLLRTYARAAPRIIQKPKRTVIVDERMGKPLHTDKWLSHRRNLLHLVNHSNPV